jgi:hypothetical protein
VSLIVQRYKPERLKNASLSFSDRVQHLGHALHATGLRLKSDLHEVARGESPRKLQQPAVDRHDVNVALRLLAVSKLDDYWCGCEFDTICTMSGVGLGKVCHASPIWHWLSDKARLPKPIDRIRAAQMSQFAISKFTTKQPVIYVFDLVVDCAWRFLLLFERGLAL